MQFNPSDQIIYPENEKEKLKRLEKLFNEWYNVVLNNPTFRNYTEKDLVFDGFYPYYFSQKIKILFIGRESIGINGENYIENLYHAYKNNYIGSQHINTNAFARRLMYIAYGILNNMPEWSLVPYPNAIAETFATPSGISFAFMNISKFSNSGENWQADWDLIENSYNSAINKGKNLIEQEIEILEPDIIISMNLDDKINSFGTLSIIQETNPMVHEYWINSKNGRKILLLNAFHFTAFKNDYDTFYQPLCEAALKKIGN